MSDQKKDGFFKRIFGGSKGCCCDVQVKEVQETLAENEVDPDPKAKCCASDHTSTPRPGSDSRCASREAAMRVVVS